MRLRRRRRDLRPRGLEEVQRDREALALLPQPPPRRDTRVLQHDRARVRGAQPELLLLASSGHAGIAFLEDERRHAAVDLGEDDGDGGDAAVRDVALLAVQDVVVALAHGSGADRGEVGAGMRLGEGDGRERPVLGREEREVALALFLCPGVEERPDREHRRGQRPSETRAAPGQLLRDQRRGQRAHAPAAVLLGNRVGRQAGARGPLEQAVREIRTRVALGRDRPQLAVGEVVRKVAELALLIRQLERDAHPIWSTCRMLATSSSAVLGSPANQGRGSRSAPPRSSRAARARGRWRRSTCAPPPPSRHRRRAPHGCQEPCSPRSSSPSPSSRRRSPVGAALGHVARRRLARPCPVVPLAGLERAVRDRLVSPPA